MDAGRRAPSSASPTASGCGWSSRRGSVEAPVAFDPSLRPGLASFTPHFSEEVDVNVLTNDAWDPKSGTSEFKATAIRIEKVAAGDAAGGRRSSHVDLRLSVGRRRARPSERAAVDAVAATSSPATRSARRAFATPGTPPAAGGTCCCPALHAVSDAVGWISRGRAQPRRAAAVGAAGRRLRGGHVLRDVRRRAAGAARRARLRRHRLRPVRRRGDRRPAGATSSGPRAPATDACWVRSPCLGLCERAPAVLLQLRRRARRQPARPARAATSLDRGRADAGDPDAAGLADRAFADTTVSAPQAGGPRPAAAAPGRASSTRRASTTTAPTAATRRCAGPSSSGRPG